MKLIYYAVVSAAFASAQPEATLGALYAASSPPSVVTSLGCFIQGSAAPSKLGRGARPEELLRQKVMVRNASRALLSNGAIDFTVAFADGAGDERPVADMPRSIGSGETVQIATAYMATECTATFRPILAVRR